MGITKKYWSSLDELQGTAAAQEALTSEFKRDQSVQDFLMMKISMNRTPAAVTF